MTTDPRDRHRRPRDRRRADLSDGLYGKVRLEVDGDKPVFAGDRPHARRRRLPARQRARDADRLDVEPFEPDYRTIAGTRARDAPATQTLLGRLHRGRRHAADWKVEDGDWSVVVMNADGSRGVDARVSAGASVPSLDDLGYGSRSPRWCCVLLGGTLLAEALRRRPRPSSPAGSASGSMNRTSSRRTSNSDDVARAALAEEGHEAARPAPRARSRRRRCRRRARPRATPPATWSAPSIR